MALANFVPCIPQEAAHIARLGACCLVSWPNNSSSEGEDDGQAEEEEDGQVVEEEDGQAEEDEREEEEPAEVEGQGEVSPKLSSGSVELKQGERNKRLNHRNDDDCGSGGLSWTRKNLSLLMTHGWTPMPQLVATPLYI